MGGSMPAGPGNLRLAEEEEADVLRTETAEAAVAGVTSYAACAAPGRLASTGGVGVSNCSSTSSTV